MQTRKPTSKDAFLSPDAVIFRPEATIADAMSGMNESGIGIALITGDDGRLLGVVVDSDVRRALLRNPDMGERLYNIMNDSPLTLPANMPVEELRELSRGITHSYVPLTGPEGRVVRLLHVWALEHGEFALPNAAVVMAGGRGSRLQPLTADVPKPMVEVGGRPILETLIEQLAGNGVRRVYLAVNYLSELIEDHFGDGERFNVDITYLREAEPRGTAGALSFVAGRESEPILVMNGDILTRLPIRSLLDFHKQEDAAATIAVRNVSIDVPFGVVEIEKNRMVSIIEKPSRHYYVSAGVYVLASDALAHIPSEGQYDMPDLLADMNRRDSGSVACFPVPEYWRDIGRHGDLHQAQADFGDLFGN